MEIWLLVVTGRQFSASLFLPAAFIVTESPRVQVASRRSPQGDLLAEQDDTASTISGPTVSLHEPCNAQLRVLGLTTRARVTCPRCASRG
jgi:hypothetical protein